MAISATYTNTEQTAVAFTVDGATNLVPVDYKGEFRDGIGGVVGFLAKGGTIAPYVAPPEPFKTLKRVAFLFAMEQILGVTVAQVETLIDAMPAGNPQQTAAKALARYVIREQQDFERNNALLASLSAAAGLTTEQVDAAWRTAEQIVW